MIRSKLNLLREQKALDENRKLPLRVIAEETSLAFGTLQAISSGRFRGVQNDTLETLCKYFECGVGDLLEYVPEPESEDKS